MPSADELYRRLGPAGVRQLNQLFTAGGFTDEEKEEYIQKMSQNIYAQQGQGGPLGGLANLPDSQRGPIASSTPSYAPYGPSGGGAPPSEEIVRSPRPQASQQSGPDWQAGLLALGGLSKGGGNAASALVLERRRRQAERQEQEERFLNQVDLMREEARLRQAGASAAEQAKAAAGRAKAEASDVSFSEVLKQEDLTPEDRRAYARLQILTKAHGPEDAIKLFNAASPELKFITAKGEGGDETVQTFHPREGTRGQAYVIGPPKEQKITPLPGDRVGVQPQRGPISVPLEEYPGMQRQPMEVPEGARQTGALGNMGVAEFQPKEKEAMSNEDMDTAVRILSNGQFQRANAKDVPPELLAAAEQRVNAQRMARASAGAPRLSIGEKADEKYAATRVLDLPGMTTIVRRADLANAPYDAKMPSLPSSEWAEVRGEAGQKKLAAARESAKIVAILERAAGKMSDAPGANWGQAFQTYASEFAGQLGPLSDLNALQGLQMAVMRILGESGSQVSDMDMRRMDRLFPKVGDGGPVVKNKIAILREFAQGIKSSVLGEGVVDVPGFLSRAEEKMKTTPRKYNRETGRIE